MDNSERHKKEVIITDHSENPYAKIFLPEKRTGQKDRPKSYIERMLEAGMACPYFIWPNINPFRGQNNLSEAVPQPGNIEIVANGPTGLGPARQWVRNAREQQLGIFENGNPLLLQPFELRFLSRMEPLRRWIIDLNDINSNKLLGPVNYHEIPKIEDRLFIPNEYVPQEPGMEWG